MTKSLTIQEMLTHQTPLSQQISFKSEKNNLEGITVLIVFLLVVMVAIYLICMFLVVIRKSKTIFSHDCKYYYLVVIFYIITKMFLCAWLLIMIISQIPNNWKQMQPEDIEIILKNSIQFADLSIVQLFMVALYFYLKMCFIAINEKGKKNVVKKSLHFGVKVSVVLATMAFLIPLIIFDLKLINYTLLNLVSTAFNGIVIILFLSSFFYLNFTMTGIMVQKKLNKSIKTIYKVLCVTLISRLIMIAIEIIIIVKINDGSFASFIEVFQSINGEIIAFGACFIGAILCILVTEGLPMMYCLRSSIVEAFVISSSHKDETSTGTMHESMITSNTSVKEQLLKDHLFQYDEPEIDEVEEISMRQFRNTVDMKQDENSIWVLKKGTIGQDEFVIRVAKHQISSYILEDIQTQIKKWNQLKLKHLNPITYFMEKQIVCIVEKYMPMNLDAAVNKIESEKSILKVALQLARAIEELHQNEIAHGCLKPTYILFNHQKKLYLTGLGLQSLKKYLSLITGYSNKSLYTSVELLSDRHNVIIKPKKQSDIYSFGIILYQMLTKNRLYRQQTLKQIQNKFCEQNFRPKIPDNMKSELKSLIRKCWQEQSSRRPSIQIVIELIQKILDSQAI